MKSIILLILLQFALSTSAQDSWQLVWSDEFNGEGRPDEATWNFETGFVRNHEDQWYQADNAFQKDGVLVIEARREHRDNPTYQPGSNNWGRARQYIDYTSSCITSARKRTFLYGRLEVRAKIPVASGAWPAIWTLGTSMEWPSCGEVDVMEFYRINGVPHLLANAAWGSDQRWNAVWNSKRIPFTNMIYIGDGLSDVPCMKMMKSYGGKSIAVYQALDEKVKELLRKDRVDYIYPADYRDGTGLDRTVKDIIRNMAISDRLYEENANQLKRLT